MISLSERRIVLVVRPTRLDHILAKENTLQQARFKLKTLNAASQAFSKTSEDNATLEIYEAEHQQYQDSVRKVREELSAALLKVQLVDKRFLPRFLFAPDDIVICIGQDGLVANTLKYLNGQPVIGVNPDKKSYDGVLLPFEPKDAFKAVKGAAQGSYKYSVVSMAEAGFPDGRKLLAVNDFFIGQRTHVSARYIIKYQGYKEPQSSSGIIVSTGLGSTGWLKSVIAGAKGISKAVIGSAGLELHKDMLEEDEDYGEYEAGDALQAAPVISQMEERADEPQRGLRKARFSRMDAEAYDAPMPAVFRKSVPKRKREFGASELSEVIGKRDSKALTFAVREPFASVATGTDIVFGIISKNAPLRVESLMGENGVIFSDGIESDFLEFNSGMEVTVKLAQKEGKLVI